MSKNLLVLPHLTPMDLIKLSQFKTYMEQKGHKMYMELNHDKRRYIVKKDDKLGFVQKEHGKLFITYKNSDETDDVSGIVNINRLFEKYNIFPEDKLFNINGITKLLRNNGSII